MKGRLWLDASVALQVAVTRQIAELARACGVSVTVHPHVHLEMCRHLRARRGDRYSAAAIRTLLGDQRIQVAELHLDQALAERWADRLSGRYPSTQAWEEAKRSTLSGELRKDFVHEPGRMPMTTDWWVALQVEDGDDDRVATDDNGAEWDSLRRAGRAMDSGAARQWLASMDPRS